MSLETIRDLLVADAAVTALVGARVSPLVRAQDETSPAVTLIITDVTPMANLASPPTLELRLVEVNSWATTYDEAIDVSNACRAALEAAGLNLQGQSERYEPSVEEYLVTQTFTYFV
jgi:hypothetical protein